uniref:Uncharacterized protein n=1 Tax=Oryza punctata TaxID=4537 RepID=A0A0E0LF95_ORYPU
MNSMKGEGIAGQRGRRPTAASSLSIVTAPLCVAFEPALVTPVPVPPQSFFNPMEMVSASLSRPNAVPPPTTPPLCRVALTPEPRPWALGYLHSAITCALIAPPLCDCCADRIRSWGMVVLLGLVVLGVEGVVVVPSISATYILGIPESETLNLLNLLTKQWGGQMGWR